MRLMTNNWAALILGVTCWITPATAQTPCPLLPSTITVTDAAGLLRTLNSNFFGTILIPSNAEINLTGQTGIRVKSCVHIKGTRNGLDPGALVYTKSTEGTDKPEGETHLFVVEGHDVRIEGLRFQGPVPTDTESQRKAKWLVNAIAVVVDLRNNKGRDVVIENNNFWFWTAAVVIGCQGCDWVEDEPLMTRRQAGLISVTRNYFHRNAREGAGYGVVVGSGYVLIECNLFTHNRHAVSHGGLKTSGYVARHNYILEGGFTQGMSWNQHFDVHGTGSLRKGYGSDAGEYFEIAYNTIRGEQTYSVPPFRETRPAFMLRGKSTVKALFHDNVVVHNDEGKAVRLKTGFGGCPTKDACNLDIGPNLYNTDTSSELAVGDFDGDGRDDIFLANGTGWWYSSAGVTEWQFLRRSPLRIKDLRFGRFDSDAKTDVLFTEGARWPVAGDWYVWSAGQDTANWVRGDGTHLADCVFGDFDGDGITDALRANGTTWSVAPAAQGPWILKRNSRVAAVNLRTFKGAGHDQIFWIDDAWSLWDPVGNWETGDHRNPLRSSDFASLVVADFDGDGTADVAQTKDNGWRWIRGGTNTWAPLRGAGGQYYYKNIREVVLGRFTPGDRRLDAVRYEMSPDPFRQQPSAFIPGRNFVIWKGFGTPDAFEPWTPPLQEMR